MTITKGGSVTAAPDFKGVHEDLLKLMDKTDELEQMIYNLSAKISINHNLYHDRYKLVNDRITEAFEFLRQLERKE